MCGIMAALPDYGHDGAEVSRARLAELLPERPPADPGTGPDRPAGLAAALDGLVTSLATAAETYALPSAGHRLATEPRLREELLTRVDGLGGWLDKLDGALDSAGGSWDLDLLEEVQRLARQARDLLWSIENDRVRAAARAAELAGDAIGDVRMARAYLAVDTVLDAIDRLEVRGRDSAGVQVWITLDEADLARLPESLRDRRDGDYGHGAVTRTAGGLTLVYKRASIIGRLGENVAYLRAAIGADAALREVLALPSARAAVLAHTRWASVGRISEANAHPVDSAPEPGGYATAVLNGDIDNHLELRETLGLPSDGAAISTDAKLVPVMLARTVGSGAEPVAALAGCLRSYQGSFAIAAHADAEPDRLYLAVRGSGQGLYVGFAPGCFLVASEVYGLVARTDRYLRLDGTARTPDGDTGVVVELRRPGAGGLAALRRYDALAQPLPVGEAELATAGITTRDVTRGAFDHYLAKEITEAPSSFRKSLRGRIADDGERLTAVLGESALPRTLRDRFAAGGIGEVIFVGQGTAAVACRGIANVVRQLLHPAVSVEAMPATELSAWGLRPDMSAACVVAVSQSGTTTDTNRAVDMVRARGAAVLCIVNRRDSDLTHRSDGVLYTSDGRDVEMAVASTKAFYSQVATGAVLGLQLARLCGRLPGDLEDTLLRALLEIPHQLEELQRDTGRLAEVAQVALRHPHWAVVGSGPNRVAAEETRIKLSELCYKSISTDAVEDKKHVDLSAEAFVLVCAAGAPAGQVRDLCKEVDIFAAHRNAPVVIVDRDVDLPWATDWVIRVPPAHPIFAWVLSTAAGHLLAYHTARAIDAKADPLRESLAALEASVDAGAVALADLDRACDGLHQFLAECAQGAVRGVLGSDTAVRLAQTALFLRHGGATLPTRITDPADFVREQVTAAVDELTRSIDSVMHQAKTVTVGTSRGEEDLLDNLLTATLVEAGADPATMSYPVLVALRAFARVVAGVEGATRYQVNWAPERSTIRATRKIGAAAALASRADNLTELRGSKRLAVQSRTVRLVRGAHDGRLVLLVPEQTGGRVNGLTLVHVALREAADPAQLTEILDLTGNRLEEIRAAVTETDLEFDGSSLARLPVETVLIGPVDEITMALTTTAH
ncbi:SIS domain-containing protein [Micromonospora sp. NPDC049559]|uniref:SIS domain-containing protein n=1 Tax=Micromonospora sp. NPDC049559 TaxID=3155923 RepID=UPI00342AFB5C